MPRSKSRPASKHVTGASSHCLQNTPLLAVLAIALLPACQPYVGSEVPAAGAALSGARFELIRPWGELPAGRNWGEVSGIDIDLDRLHLWVADRCASNCVGSDVPVVLRFDSSGNLLTSFGAGLFIRPHGLFVDAEGNIWVTDDQGPSATDLASHPELRNVGHQVLKFSRDGRILMRLGTGGVPGDPPHHLTAPGDVVVAANGDIFVAEGHGGRDAVGRISKFSSNGTFIKTIGRLGPGPGEFDVPHGLALDSQGRLFVADRGNSRIQILDQEGRFIDELRQFGRPNDVFIDDDVLYSVDSQSNAENNPGVSMGIYIGSVRTGELLHFIPATTTSTGERAAVEGIAVDARGDFYTGEVTRRGLSKYIRRN